MVYRPYALFPGVQVRPRKVIGYGQGPGPLLQLLCLSLIAGTHLWTSQCRLDSGHTLLEALALPAAVSAARGVSGLFGDTIHPLSGSRLLLHFRTQDEQLKLTRPNCAILVFSEHCQFPFSKEYSPRNGTHRLEDVLAAFEWKCNSQSGGFVLEGGNPQVYR
jgi:hypothetical protein